MKNQEQKTMTKAEALAKGYEQCCDPTDGDICWDISDISTEDILDYKPRILEIEPMNNPKNVDDTKWAFTEYTLIP